MIEVLKKIPKRLAVLGTGLFMGVSVLTAGGAPAFSEGSGPCTQASSVDLVPEKFRTNVIYWGEWTRDSVWAQNIKDPRWRDRWPYYTSVNPKDGSGIISGDTQKVMDQNIRYWTDFNIDSVSFVYYAPFSPQFSKYNKGLNRFLNSKEVNPVTFSLILQGSHLLNQSGHGEFTDDILELLKNPKYQRINEDRPLIYIYDIPNLVKSFGSKENVKKAIVDLRVKTESAQAGKLLVAGLDADNSNTDLGFDAFGSYSANGAGEEKEYPYSLLMEANRTHWDKLGLFGKDVILPVNIGWDPRPRFSNPEIGLMYRGNPWYSAPKPEQITQNILAAYEWMKRHPICSSLQTILIYAWNEYDEGLRLSPGLDDGDIRLKAVRQAKEFISN